MLIINKIQAKMVKKGIKEEIKKIKTSDQRKLEKPCFVKQSIVRLKSGLKQNISVPICNDCMTKTERTEDISKLL